MIYTFSQETIMQTIDPTETAATTQAAAPAPAGAPNAPKMPRAKASPRPRHKAASPAASPAAPATGGPVDKPATQAAAETPAKKAVKATVKATPPKARKTSPASKPAVAAVAEKTEAAAAKQPKLKLVRDSFTIPQADFELIGQLKARALAFQRPAKKSELLRAGLHALAALDDAALRRALDALVPLKAGRPKKTD
jgi:hypothetical protein